MRWRGGIGQIARNRGMGPVPECVDNPYSERRVGKQPDGSFIISGVPAPAEWYASSDP